MYLAGGRLGNRFKSAVINGKSYDIPYKQIKTLYPENNRFVIRYYDDTKTFPFPIRKSASIVSKNGKYEAQIVKENNATYLTVREHEVPTAADDSTQKTNVAAK